MSQLALTHLSILQIKEKKKKRKTIFKIKEKKKKKKRNNDLAILPSHDTTPLSSFLVPRNFLQLVAWVHHVAHLVIIIFCLFSNS